MTTNTNPRIQLLLTGNEIMSGDTIDSNSARIARELAPFGLNIARKVTVGDDLALLKTELSRMREQADVVIINGGLGPTVDDLTAQLVAEVSGVALSEHVGALAHLQSWCAKRNLPLNEANRKQALLPEGCELIANPIGSAVGFAMPVGQCRVICTPGVPSELTAMLKTIAPSLGGEGQQRIVRLQSFGLGESTAQQMVNDEIRDWPEDVELGFRAGAPQMEIKLTTRSKAAQVKQDQYVARLKQLFGEHIIGEKDATIEAEVLRLLGERGQQLCTAESCTGGLIASTLTAVPGASEVFHAGFVTYDNDIKQRVLGVREATLKEHGAVSEAVVREMAQGALAASGAHYAVATSGIAGPGGGSAEKPVGTVWIAWGNAERIDTCGLLWPLSRTLFQTMISAAALDLLRRRLLGNKTPALYLQQRALRTSQP